MTLVDRIGRGLSDREDALVVQLMMEALAQMMSAWPVGARETPSYRMAEQALADALALRSAFDEA
ncbi:hypothetical protein EDC61_11473 [Sulfuritortus calidifontis]|uniref:Uncharacterized protein n=1 Tax=Sulfuritortus calidifontis TaxID=1914471 RepID=A0A4R3JVN6_9PROT|nr:hypothetical protein [Sulfuritortus calidifontis]TCS70746.1 hypothetical protein EDC61_11473 [Sulfuritortus calidifontis]